MTFMDVKIEGDFLDEPREELTKCVDIMGGASAEVSIDPGTPLCTFCQEDQDDADGRECNAADDGEHEFEELSLTWADRMKITPDASNDEIRVAFHPTGKAGQVNVTFKVDAETGKLRMVVDTWMAMSERSLELRQVDSENPNGQRTDFLIG